MGRSFLRGVGGSGLGVVVDAEAGRAGRGGGRRARGRRAGAGRGRSNGSSYAIRPSSISSTRSASSSASSTSCVTSRTAGPVAAATARLTSACAEMRVSASSALNGSSSSSRSGSRTSARASATRWRWPPESCRGHAVLAPVEADLGERGRRARSRGSAPRRPSATFSSAVRHGSSRGSWKTTAGAQPGRELARVAVVEPGEQRAAASSCPSPSGRARATNSPGRDVEVDAVEHDLRRRMRARRRAGARPSAGRRCVGASRHSTGPSARQRSACRSSARTIASVIRPRIA